MNKINIIKHINNGFFACRQKQGNYYTEVVWRCNFSLKQYPNLTQLKVPAPFDSRKETEVVNKPSTKYFTNL